MKTGTPLREPIGAVAGESRDASGPGDVWGRIAWVAGGFVLAIAAAMFLGQWVQPREEPWSSGELAAALIRLEEEPRNEALKERIRELDAQRRVAYFRRIERNRMGAGLLLAGAVLWVLTARLGWGRRAPVLPSRLATTASERERERRRSERAVLWAGAAVVVVLAVSGWWHPGMMEAAEAPVGTAEAAVGSAVAEPVVTEQPAERGEAGNWPRFLGPGGALTGSGERVPLRWDLAGSEGVRWKAPVPLGGFNSPVVWGDRVYLTGGNRRQRLVFAFHADTGELLWQRPVTPRDRPAESIEPPDMSGAAASTAATDGTRVYAIFATGELGALDRDGNLVWFRRLDLEENAYGHAASLVVWRDLLFVQADQGRAADGLSRLRALDTRTGEERWVAERPVASGWTTPVVVEVAGREQLVLAGDPWVIAYAPSSGQEWWRARLLGNELAPSPVLSGDRIVVVSPERMMAAVRADGSGDVTESHVVWREERDVPDVPTPLAAGDWLFSVDSHGLVMCREASTGKVLWEHAYRMEFQASPVRMGDRILLLAHSGKGFVIQAAAVFQELATFDVGEEVSATPALAGGRLYVRTHRTLACIEGPAESVEGTHANGH